MTMPRRWIRLLTVLFALFAILTIASLGSLLGHFLGPAKSFFLIIIGMVIWLIPGWFIGGWRLVLAGIAALAAALTASDGTYPLALVLCCIAFLFLFADISPRDTRAHPKSLTLN